MAGERARWRRGERHVISRRRRSLGERRRRDYPPFRPRLISIGAARDFSHPISIGSLIGNRVSEAKAAEDTLADTALS